MDNSFILSECVYIGWWNSLDRILEIWLLSKYLPFTIARLQVEWWKVVDELITDDNNHFSSSSLLFSLIHCSSTCSTWYQSFTAIMNEGGKSGGKVIPFKLKRIDFLGRFILWRVQQTEELWIEKWTWVWTIIYVEVRWSKKRMVIDL